MIRREQLGYSIGIDLSSTRLPHRAAVPPQGGGNLPPAPPSRVVCRSLRRLAVNDHSGPGQGKVPRRPPVGRVAECQHDACADVRPVALLVGVHVHDRLQVDAPAVELPAQGEQEPALPSRRRNPFPLPEMRKHQPYALPRQPAGRGPRGDPRGQTLYPRGVPQDPLSGLSAVPGGSGVGERGTSVMERDLLPRS